MYKSSTQQTLPPGWAITFLLLPPSELCRRSSSIWHLQYLYPYGQVPLETTIDDSTHLDNLLLLFDCLVECSVHSPAAFGNSDISLTLVLPAKPTPSSTNSNPHLDHFYSLIFSAVVRPVEQCILSSSTDNTLGHLELMN